MLKAIFDYDNPVMSFICRIIDLCVLSLLWLLCSLPVVTVGTATCSLYYAVIKSVRRQRSYPAREFLGCFRKNLKLSLLLWLLFLFFGAITFKVYLPLAAHFWFSSLWVDKILAVLLTVGIFFFASLLLWSFPILSRFDTGILKILELSMLQALRAAPYHCSVSDFYHGSSFPDPSGTFTFIHPSRAAGMASYFSHGA